MASSLDDMEAYELLQIELDRSLQVFSATLSDKAQTLHFLNSWIEYICFMRHLWKWEEIVSAETEESFLKWYEEVGGEHLSLDMLKKFQSSFK
ncbi:MAG: hypothetical protein JWO58_3079 [Chitinophagaceae bacterium]|nr:hypothetical protein [Chitinophagaceae bacterium]